MKAQTRFGGIWVAITLILIFAPLAIITIYMLQLPESQQNGAVIAIGFSGFPLLILLIALRSPWHRRTITFQDSLLTVSRTKDSKIEFVLDASKPFQGFLAIREGPFGKNGGAIIRWVQASLKQNNALFLLEFPINQKLNLLNLSPAELPIPTTDQQLHSLLGQSFVIDEHSLNCQTGKKPYTVRGANRFLETDESFTSLAIFLAAHTMNNQWRPDNSATEIKI